MNALLAFSAIALIHGSYATLLIKGPTEPVQEGDKISLECLNSDSEQNMDDVTLEINYKTGGWHPVYEGNECYWPTHFNRSGNGLSLVIRSASSMFDGDYRCVSTSENVTAPNNASQPFTLIVHYMPYLKISQAGIWRYLPSYGKFDKDLKVPLGDDVVVECSSFSTDLELKYFWQKEGGDWILPSTKLSLEKVTASDGGKYTCVAQHPTVPTLMRRGTISITVLPEDAPWYDSSKSRVILMTSAVAVVVLVLILSMSVFLCRKAKQANTSKGPIDDRSQKKPIYRASVESLPSSCADKQPLV